jgi:hypothetical protein
MLVSSTAYAFYDHEEQGDKFLQHMDRNIKSYIKLRHYMSFTWRIRSESVSVIDDEEKQKGSNG